LDSAISSLCVGRYVTSKLHLKIMLQTKGLLAARGKLSVTSVGMIDTLAIRRRWEADGSKRDERGRRLFAASEVRAAGRGGLAAVSSITGLARSTIGRGLKDLDATPLPMGQVRREGGGPRLLTERDPTLLADLKRLVEPATRGDPVRSLLWISKSLDKLASALGELGHSVSPNSVRKLLTEIGFSRQVNRKAYEGASHPDRNAQLEYINVTDCDVHQQFPAARLLLPRLAGALAENRQLHLAHRSLHAQQQPVVRHARVVDAVLVDDERVNHSAELEECVPFASVARKTRGFDRQNAADAALTDRRQ
jgi:hypothetical protein